MNHSAVEKVASNWILIFASLATIFVMTASVTDPVNTPKLLIVGGLGIALLALTVTSNLKIQFRDSAPLILATASFVITSLLSVLASQSPLVLNLYGSFGRNTGFIAYFVFAGAMMGAALIRDKGNFKKLIWAIYISGGVNVLYCGWVLVFGDFIGWNNPYGNILGTFGNPDFISAFLGMFIASLSALVFSNTHKVSFRISAAVIIVVAFYEVHRSHAIQGVAVTALGLSVVVFYWIRARFNSFALSLGYLIAVMASAALAVAGALQKGPLAFIYKTSVSLRGSYWHAGIKMGMDHPLTGVGMDSYGDWYRRTRSLHAATSMPGPNTTSNAAHNVVIDIFAYGGFPLLISYLAILAIGTISIFRVTRRIKEYDWVFVSIASVWLCYEAQSIISINQVGLALWGWIFTGALVAYEVSTKPGTVLKSDPNKSAKRRSTSSGVFSPQLIAGIGAVIGLIIACPPLSSDTRWKAAVASGNAQNVENALKQTYLSPQNSQRYVEAVYTFEKSKLPDLALKYALEGIKFNPNFFDAWRALYSISGSTAEQKQQALHKMKLLDPLNPDVTK